MQKESVYSVKDVKAGNFLPPFTAGNDVVASRLLSQVVNQGRGNLAEFPEDFDLYQVGTWDSEVGNIEPTSQRFVLHVNSLKKGQQNVLPQA